MMSKKIYTRDVVNDDLRALRDAKQEPKKQRPASPPQIHQGRRVSKP